MESLLALRRENKEVLWSSMIKDTMKRKKPSFNETYHGYRTFSELLEDAAKQGLLELETDKRSRTYVVTRFGSELSSPVETPSQAGARKKSRRRRSGSKRKEGTTPKAVVEKALTEPHGESSAPEMERAQPPLDSIPDEEITFSSPDSEPLPGEVEEKKRSEYDDEIPF
jgi:hypothetical protein